jgi:tetratricopeptide (TPR) repeat protein
MIDRDDLERLFRQANEEVEARRYEDAIDVYREVLTLAGEHDPLAAECAHWGIGEISLGLGDYETAAGSMLAALAINPDEAAYHYMLGLVFLKLGVSGAALDALARAHDLEPDRPRVLRAYGWALHSAGNRQRGMEMLRTALALRPDHPGTLTRLGWAYADEERPGEALVCLERATETAPWDLEARVALSTVARFAGQDPAAMPIPATGPASLAQEDDWDDEEWEDDDADDATDDDDLDEDDDWADDDDEDWEDDDWDDDEQEEDDWDDDLDDEDDEDDDLIDIN